MDRSATPDEPTIGAPEGTIEILESAWNRHDSEAATLLFHESGAVRFLPPIEVNEPAYVGRMQLTHFWERMLGDDATFDAGPVEISDDRCQFRARLSGSLLRRIGVPSAEATCSVEFQYGRLFSLQIAFDEQIAAHLVSVLGDQPTRSRRMLARVHSGPQIAGIPLTPIAIGVGLAALIAGSLAIWRLRENANKSWLEKIVDKAGIDI